MWQFARLSVTATCLGTCALIVVIWMRAPRWHDSIYFVPPDGSTIYRIDAQGGQVFVGYCPGLAGNCEPGLLLGSFPYEEAPADSIPDSYFGVAPLWGPGYRGAYLSYWLVLALSGATAALLNRERLRHFSLRTALIAMLIAALTLGLGSMAAGPAGNYSWRVW